jgi:hypothetical protein
MNPAFCTRFFRATGHKTRALFDFKARDGAHQAIPIRFEVLGLTPVGQLPQDGTVDAKSVQ